MLRCYLREVSIYARVCMKAYRNHGLSKRFWYFVYSSLRSLVKTAPRYCFSLWLIQNRKRWKRWKHRQKNIWQGRYLRWKDKILLRSEEEEPPF
jgi:hypothetical protein